LSFLQLLFKFVLQMHHIKFGCRCR
jgi:hypothetical protein